MAFIEIDKSVRKDAWLMNSLHSHPHYEIYFLNKGSRLFFLNNSLKRINAPDIVVIPPCVMHKTEGDAFERFNINVSEKYLDDFEKHVLSKIALKHLKPDQKQAEEILNVMNRLCSIDRSSKYGEKNFHTIFSYLIVLLNGTMNFSEENTHLDKPVVPPVLLNMIDYITENYANQITLESLSEMFFISKGTIFYNFKRYANDSPIDFVINVRIAKAKEFLLTTNLSINEISEKCGFSSSNYFGLIFKQKVGLAPAVFRRHNKTKE